MTINAALATARPVIPRRAGARWILLGCARPSELSDANSSRKESGSARRLSISRSLGNRSSGDDASSVCVGLKVSPIEILYELMQDVWAHRNGTGTTRGDGRLAYPKYAGRSCLVSRRMSMIARRPDGDRRECRGVSSAQHLITCVCGITQIHGISSSERQREACTTANLRNEQCRY